MLELNRFPALGLRSDSDAETKLPMVRDAWRGLGPLKDLKDLPREVLSVLSDKIQDVLALRSLNSASAMDVVQVRTSLDGQEVDSVCMACEEMRAMPQEAFKVISQRVEQALYGKRLKRIVYQDALGCLDQHVVCAALLLGLGF